jgi:hypothetical protein
MNEGKSYCAQQYFFLVAPAEAEANTPDAPTL